MPDHSGETYDWVREHITGELSAKAGASLARLKIYGKAEASHVTGSR